MWYCYLLKSYNKTYIGATIDPDRRLRQHNGELSGGAKATKGYVWTRHCLVGIFDNEHNALSFEWHWKHNSKKYKGNAIERRMKALESMLKDENHNLTVEFT
jgi:structure-specific endonuclease subunit SLX1